MARNVTVQSIECETRTGLLDRNEPEFALQGELAAEQRERLLLIANRCPVHRTLASEVRIDSRPA